MFSEQEIIDYIELVRDSVPNAIEIFTKGNCGSFSLMLMKTFPGGEIKNLVGGHLIYEYNDQWYDITGAIPNRKYKYEDAEPIIRSGKDLYKAIRLLKPRYKTI